MRVATTALAPLLALAGCGGGHADVRTVVHERVQTQTVTVKDASVPVAPAQAATAAPSPPSASVRYIAQLGSFTHRDGAEAYAADFRARGIRAAVLRSDGYLELRDGYWVVYAGFFEQQEQADSVAKSARTVSPGAFARRVTYDATR